MTFEEIKTKFENCPTMSIVEIKDIQVSLNLIRELSRQGYTIDPSRI